MWAVEYGVFVRFLKRVRSKDQISNSNETIFKCSVLIYQKLHKQIRKRIGILTHVFVSADSVRTSDGTTGTLSIVSTVTLIACLSAVFLSYVVVLAVI